MNLHHYKDITTIQQGGNPDYRIYAANNGDNALRYCENNQYPGFFSAVDGTNGAGTSREWLYIREAEPIVDPVGDWLLYFDDDFDEITIHVGETITLRPYDKWEWKEGNTDVQSAHWNIGGKDNSYWNQIDSGDNNGAHKSEWNDGGNGTNTAAFHWTAYVKEDTQLKTHYWSVQGRATQTGVYYLTNTKNGKTIKVNVVDGDPVNKPPTITDTVDIKVNLFDYDRDYRLDPEDNTNLANNSNNKGDSTNAMAGNSHFYFLSSGSGNNNNESWNSYTQGASNPGIVKTELGTDGYPALAGNGQNSQSLIYLFDTTKTYWNGGNNDGMIAYPNVGGMFRKDNNGYYYFNSNTNYFYYDASTGNSSLYEHTYTQTSGKDKGSLVNDKPIGFFPFHDYDATDNLYVNQNHNLNHHVGLSMEIPFRMNEQKVDEKGNPIKFEFTGDDDLWVFAEWEDAQGNKHSKLLLDVGGIHQPVYGYIDFTQDKSSSLNSMGLQPGIDYKLKVYYLERGGCDSNLAIRFNLPLTDIGDVPFTKQDALTGAPMSGIKFGLYEDVSCNGDSKVREAVSDENGHVLFSDLSIGTYYLKEISTPEGYYANTTVYRVEVKAKNKAEITRINGEEAKSDYSYKVDNVPVTNTGITVKKLWKKADGTEDTTKTGNITFTLIQTAYTYTINKKDIQITGEVENSETSYTGKYKVQIGTGTEEEKENSPTITFPSGQTVSISELPKFGYLENQKVLYVYSVRESGVAGYTGVETEDGSGNWTIANQPVADTDKETKLKVSKIWENAAEQTVSPEDSDSIQFVIHQRIVKTGYVPVTIKLYNPYSYNPVATRTIYVKKSTKFSYEMGVGTLFDTPNSLRETITTPTETAYNNLSGNATRPIKREITIDGPTTITELIRSNGVLDPSSLGSWAQDPWKAQDETWRWYFDYSGTADYKESFTDLIDAFKNTTTGDSVKTETYKYDMVINNITAVTDPIEGEVTTAIFSAEFTKLPLFRKVRDDYCAYYYTVDEIKVNGESVTVDSSGQHTSEYYVAIDTQTDSQANVTNTTITNTERPGALKITKILTINGVPSTDESADGTYTFSVLKADGIHQATKKDGTPVEDQTIKIVDGVITKINDVEVDENHGFILVGDLVPGDYVIKEVDPEDGTVLTNISGGKANTADINNRRVTVTVKAGDDTAADAAAAVVFTNDKSTKTEINILKADSTGNHEPLTGAKFTLKRYDQGYHGVVEEKPEWTDVIVDDGQVNPDKKGMLVFEDLAVGYYELEETKSPNGYIKTSSNPRFTVQANPQTGLLEVVFTDTEMVKYSKVTNTFTVYNEPGVALPSTGGPGTKLFTILGGMLMLGAGMMLFRRRFI